MQSFRRAALRAACSSQRAMAVPRQQVASFAIQISKQNLRPTTSFLLARAFSRSAPVAEEAPGSVQAKVETVRKGHTVFIGNMSYDATETHLHEAFSKYGDILSITIPRDGRGSARGFGFVNFQDEAAVEAAVEGANQSFWHGRRILVQPRRQTEEQRAKPAGRPESTPSNYLYIGNIPYETSDADLNALFNELEGLTAVRVAIDRNTGWPRGFAHADFESVEAATAAMEKINTRQMGARVLRADYTTQNTPKKGSRSSSSSSSAAPAEDSEASF
ncbi:uncharacterized protein B0I36DRAFT_317187 [Microdochium trichocladiopsis]|uniref:RRM domain-containing protein n=1 Tax=Microdochium trichocladiopsis TaxID=1682393 RepID=A0A9P8YAG0_9PEZI|nr:uncharacterized protein B0I36DRAFT_317187 [Microdochium trichocladiopsis]KAH7034898.1 hypothetical protein B0I36DRAFT_317187 [Microdochium trichocladiopsis]